jgi:hypothetical protein
MFTLLTDKPVGWVEPKAKPANYPLRRMVGFAALYPPYILTHYYPG